MGMKIEGTLRKQYFYDGRWYDSKMLSLLNEEWKLEK